MTALDLSKQSPRSTHVRIDGIAYLARAIDKVRAELPGGNLGPYVLLRDDMHTVSSMFYYRTGLTHDAFRAAVENATSDDDVAKVVRSACPPEAIEKWNKQILNTKLSDLDAETLARVYRAHPSANTLPLETLLVDVFDRDDAEMFAS